MATYSFNVGDIACMVISDGTVPINDVTQTFPNAPVDDVLKAVAESGQDAQKLQNYFNCLLITTNGQRILVDTGSGDTSRAGLGELRDALVNEGITPDQIDVVFLTHFHGDHINGLVKNDGNLTYPNATYITTDDEWNGWMSDEALNAIGEERAAGLKKVLLPIKDKLTLVSFDEEIAPGVTTIAAQGHTPGHAALLIESNGEQLMHLVDTAHRIFQLRNPAFSPHFDSQPDLSPQTREALLKQVSDDNLLTMFYHFPFPGLGHVVKDGSVYRWQPL